MHVGNELMYTDLRVGGGERRVSRSFSTLPEMRLLQHFAFAESELPAFANLISELAESLRDAGVLFVSNDHGMSLAFGVLGHSDWSHRGIKTHLHH